jgi:hypothetical protein
MQSTRVKDRTIVKHNIDSIKNLYKYPTITEYLPDNNNSMVAKKLAKVTGKSHNGRKHIRPIKMKVGF